MHAERPRRVVAAAREVRHDRLDAAVVAGDGVAGRGRATRSRGRAAPAARASSLLARVELALRRVEAGEDRASAAARSTTRARRCRSRRSARRGRRPRRGRASSRAGRSTTRTGGRSVISSACSSTSRAAAAPDAGTITSRGPAASMSGTSKPRERRSIDGTPSSSRRPWMSSASDWLRAPATRTRSPSLYCGLILRARACAADDRHLEVRAAGVRQRHAALARRSARRAGCGVPQPGQTSGCAARSDTGDLDLARPRPSSIGSTSARPRSGSCGAGRRSATPRRASRRRS